MRRTLAQFSVLVLLLGPLCVWVSADTIFLKDGKLLEGRVILFEEGKFTILLASPRAAEEEVETQVIPAEQVQRIRFGGAERAAAQDKIEAGVLTRELEVPASRPWTDTGLVLKAGERVKVEASGEVTLAGKEHSGPAGIALDDPYRPLKKEKTGALIATIGAEEGGDIFLLGEAKEFDAPRAGRLFLGVNTGDFPNDFGSYRVRVRVGEPEGLKRRGKK